MILGRNEDGYVWLRNPSTSLGNSGPSRVDTSKDEELPPLPPLGFTTRARWEAKVQVPDAEPQTWSGDDG